MAQTRWTVYAYSPKLNQRVRHFDLTHVEADITEAQARQDADYFTRLQNANCYMHTNDWQPLVVQEQHGIDTIPGFIQ